jgi:hypothetical protein
LDGEESGETGQEAFGQGEKVGKVCQGQDLRTSRCVSGGCHKT